MTHEAMVDGSFSHLRLGRLPTRHDVRTLQFENYVTAQLPAPPSSVAVPPVPSWPMYGNDRLGDCTLAAAGHVIQADTRLAGSQRTPADSTVERCYWLTGHPPATTGSPGGPTDDGRVELDVLNFWRHHGIGSDKILGYVAVDARNHSHLYSAIQLLGGVYTGIGLPLTAQRQSVWDVVGDGKTGPSAPWSWGGHAVPYVGYDQSGFTFVTWGGLLKLTTRFHDAYTEEAYAIVTRDLLNKTSGRSSQGLDLTALQADVAALALSA